ncbi:MAG: mannose-6-phosphate isomerase, class I [Treponema sp.]|jgi:mannose-6-phosphate isomerase|nr:mannose-6-phosphate isomerase, class I [Treponema sp.]
MAFLFPLKNQVKQYDWGSPVWIPRLLGLPNPSGEPWAELWMGVHPGGPSEAAAAGQSLPLPELIARDPRKLLGEKTTAAFGGLPFLFKLLAAEKPLSIQAHPNKDQARTGWERENLRGIPPDAPARNYRDRNHKPEILCALSPFTAMCGFRELPDIRSGLDCFAREAPPELRKVLDALSRILEEAPPGEDGAASALSRFLSELFCLSGGEKEALSRYAAASAADLCRKYPDRREEWETVAYFAALYPGDPALLSPLYLNLLHLEAQEALYLPAGVLHAYVRGFGVELMANSDNVLRGGLTAKHIDMEELLRVLRFSPFKPRISRPSAGDDYFRYPAECREFSLTLLRGTGGSRVFPGIGPGIVVVTQGEAVFSSPGEDETRRLRQGESAFIATREKPGDLRLSGTFTLYAAGVGRADQEQAGGLG